MTLPKDKISNKGSDSPSKPDESEGPTYPIPRHIVSGAAEFDVEANDRGENEFWTKLEQGVWEPDTLEIIETHVDSETMFLDIGGWIGPTTLFAGALGAAVVVVEADPKALPALKRNIALNKKIARRIEVVAKALYPTIGKVKFGSRRKGGDSMSSLVHEHMATSWEVDTITPERLAELFQGTSKVFMKIDIEGGEYTIFPHAKALFDLPLGAVHISLHPQFVIGDAKGLKWLMKWISLSLATARIFRHLGGYQIFRATKTGLEPAPLQQKLARFGLCLWPLQKSWLFLPHG